MDIYWIYPYDLWRHLGMILWTFRLTSGHVFRGMALEPPEPSSRPEVRVFCQNDQKSCSCWRCGFGRKHRFFRVGYRRTKARKQNAPPEFRGQIWEFIYLHGIKIMFFLWIYRIEKNKRVTGDVFVDGYDWCWCCLCAFLVPLFGRIPGPKDIMIQNDWLMAVCLRLIKENVRCEGVWLQRRKFHCSFKNACIYIIYHGQFLSVNTLNRNNPDLKLLDAYHLFTNLHQHSVWDNSQSWTTVDIYVSLILTGGIFFPQKMVGIMKIRRQKFVESSKELEFESRKLLARNVKHSWVLLVWIEGKLAKFLFSWLVFVDYSQVKTGSHQGHPDIPKTICLKDPC